MLKKDNLQFILFGLGLVSLFLPILGLNLYEQNVRRIYFTTILNTIIYLFLVIGIILILISLKLSVNMLIKKYGPKWKPILVLILFLLIIISISMWFAYISQPASFHECAQPNYPGPKCL